MAATVFLYRGLTQNQNRGLTQNHPGFWLWFEDKRDSLVSRSRLTLEKKRGSYTHSEHRFPAPSSKLKEGCRKPVLGVWVVQCLAEQSNSFPGISNPSYDLQTLLFGPVPRFTVYPVSPRTPDIKRRLLF